MTRYKMTIEYDGAPFVGWQRQKNGFSVQQRFEEAITDFCGEEVSISAAGRTDAGVHALGQVIHADLEKQTTPDTVRDAVNYYLKPNPISILEISVSAPDFHARFDAVKRHYLYRILNRRAPPALEQGKVWHAPVSLDVDAMDDAAQYLVGQHDFTTFRAAECQAKSPVKSLDAFHVSRVADEIHFSVSARSFLHTQVRSMVGTLKKVGEGKWTGHQVGQALKACNRTRCGPLAPPYGLYLLKVDYSA